MKNKLAKKIMALGLAVALAVGTVGATNYTSATVKADEVKTYPWTPVEGGTTGDYIADNYKGLESGHVFENVTQQRLVDLLKSNGNYYIVFAGPEHSSSQAIISKINDEAKKKGISKIYHYDTYVDGYQIDIKNPNTKFTGSKNNSVYQLWEKIAEQLPENEDVKNFSGEDTLIISYSNNGKTKKINGSYLLKDGKTEGDIDATALAKVLDKGKSDERSNFDFFRTIVNAAVSFSEGEPIEALKEEDRYENIKQVTFAEVLNILQSPGEHYIAFYAVWCPNVRSIFSSTIRKAKANNKTLYVFDPTFGNQLTYAEDGITVTGLNSIFSTRTSNINISYVYGEFAKFLGNIITENNTKHTNSISYQPNGDQSAEFTTVKPWEEAPAGTVKNAIRLQTPFLFAYDNSKAEPVVKQWYHEDYATDEEGNLKTEKSGTVTEYMLYYSWVFPKEGAEILADTAAYRQGLTKVQWVQEAIANLSNVLGDKELPYKGGEPGNYGGYAASAETTVKEEPTTNKKPATVASETEKATEAAVKAPLKATITKVNKKKLSSKKLTLTIKKQKGVAGYQVKVYASKKNAKANKKVLVTKIIKKALAGKSVKKVTATISSKKIKNKKSLFVKVRAFVKDGKSNKFGGWSNVKKVVVK